MQSSQKRSRDHGRALISLIDILSGAEIYQSTSQKVTESILALKKRYNLRNYHWDFMRGYETAVKNQWYREKLIYAIDFEGTVYPMEWTKLPTKVQDYIKVHTTMQITSGHYWKNADGTIGRPFFVNGITHPLVDGKEGQ